MYWITHFRNHSSYRRKATALYGQLIGVHSAAIQAFREHWSRYLYELVGLAGFMLVVGVAVSVLFSATSPVSSAVTSGILRRLLVGLVAASYLIALIYSPWGKKSGAHINPAITLAFFRLGKIKPWDAGFYILAQFVGGVLGVYLFAVIMGSWASDPAVNYIVTIPGVGGIAAAFFAEIGITFAMMLLVLLATNSKRVAPYTGVLAGSLLAVLILTESPISGTSLNPARTLGSAAVATVWTHLWLYFLAPPVGALLATVVYQLQSAKPVICAKLNHENSRCDIFQNCGYEPRAETIGPAEAR